MNEQIPAAITGVKIPHIRLFSGTEGGMARSCYNDHMMKYLRQTTMIPVMSQHTSMPPCQDQSH